MYFTMPKLERLLLCDVTTALCWSMDTALTTVPGVEQQASGLGVPGGQGAFDRRGLAVADVDATAIRGMHPSQRHALIENLDAHDLNLKTDESSRRTPTPLWKHLCYWAST